MIRFALAFMIAVGMVVLVATVVAADVGPWAVPLSAVVGFLCGKAVAEIWR